jgi:UDP-GlcNAc:undecaprenyl-phosphate/decaprenyl-phosphate GlcNAc-1-phosphate transferase
MVALLFISFITALIGVAFCIRASRRWAAPYAQSKPQRFHAGEVSRLGGVGLLLGLLAAWVAAAWAGDGGKTGGSLSVSVTWAFVLPWVFSVLPAVLGGVLEDLHQNLSTTLRLILTALSASIACATLGLGINRLHIAGLDAILLTTPWLAVGLAFVAICGLPHAFNIIDGYNGLAAAVALLICLAIAHVAMQLGDRQLAAMVLCLAGATAGFLVWNYPRGLIFAGDGGAYLWGVVIAIACILLVQRHAEVSPWFPMLLLIYPVWETVFSAYRKIARGASPGVADALHFHQLIYRRIVRSVVSDDAARKMRMRNNKTAPYLWGFTLATVVPAVLFWNNSLVLMLICAGFVAAYLAAYLMIVRFKVPGWIK